MSIALISTRRQYDALFGVYVPIAAGVFAVVVLILLGAVVLYRRRDPGAVSRRSEHNPLEAGYGIVRRSGDVDRQPLVVPANSAIRFNLFSQDVIHAFYVPELDFKRDLIPGMAEHVVLTFTRLGLFRGQCAEFCGLRHPEMVFNVRVLSPSAFAAWVQSRGRAKL
jgi:heme/copper-type cytochrome/quinol oxidase subunit 2